MTKTTTIDALAQQLKTKQTLDPALPVADRLAAAASLLQSVGKSVAPTHASPRQVLTALGNIERLASLTPGDITRVWLAVRALELSLDEKVGGPGLDHPCAAVFVAAAGGVVTFDPNDRPAGFLGEGSQDDLNRLPAKGRSVRFEAKKFAVTRQAEILFSEPASGSADALILEAIDTLPARDPAKASRQLASGAVPLDYIVLDEPQIASVDGDALFADYKLSRIRIPGAHPHPNLLVEPAALASVPLPLPTYRPFIDPKLIAGAILSDVQLEAIIYAGQAHSSRLPVDAKTGVSFRRGFLLGHGTGVGKGRIDAGIIRDNWNQGRRRAIWVTENQKLMAAATRDWLQMGGSHNDFMQLLDFAPSARLPHRDGVLFVTYALLRSPERLAQIIDWFGQTGEGVIVLDECQAGRNAVKNGKEWTQSNQVSAQGAAMLRLQEELPNARVVYSSATSAMDIASLGYAQRLGLWGASTAFPEAQNFFKQMEDGGIAALELVARDMKALGLYLAGNLSMVNVTCTRLEFKLNASERSVQDALSVAWQKINIELQKAMATTGISLIGSHRLTNKAREASARTKRLCEANFRTAKSRFFQALLASIKTKRLLPQIALDIAQGLAPVIQLTNTYEANLARSLEASTADDRSDVDPTPRDILLSYIDTQFPVFKHKIVKQNGTTTMQPILDAKGQPEADPAALQAREQLKLDVKALDIPECPLEQIIAFFGTQTVAEVTGRSRRLVPGKTPGSRMIEERGAAATEEDIRAFQDDRKKILAFSTAAGGTGGSYHADKGAKNQKKRRHYVVQAGWRADQAIQGMGRTNRSNQVCPPEYVLVCCDLWSDKRMISNVAAGMEALGALTKGQRSAAAQDLFTQEDNLESELAADAWRKFINDLNAGQVTGLTVDWFQHETGILLQQTGGFPLNDSDLPTVRRFLNAMSGMTCDRQEAFGEAYRKRLDELKLKSLQDGTFDRGVEWIQAESIIKVSDEVVWKDPLTGATTRLLQLVKREKVNPITFVDAKKKAAKYGSSTRIAVNAQTNRVAILGFPDVGFSIDTLDDILVVTPKGEQTIKRYRFEREFWRMVTPDEAKRLWDIELSQLDHAAETWFYMVTGLLLPIWDRLPKTQAQVWRLQADDGERIIGRLVSDEFGSSFVKRLNGGSVDTAAALSSLEQGATATLANGWVVYSWPAAAGGRTIELSPMGSKEDPKAWIADMEAAGIQVRESYDGKTRFLLPNDPNERDAAWSSVASKWPIMSVTSLAA